MKKLFLSAVGLMTVLSGFAGTANAWVVVHRVRIVYHRPFYRPVVRLQAPIVGRPVAGPDGDPGPQFVSNDGGETEVTGGATHIVGCNGIGDEGDGSRHRESRAEGRSGGERRGHDGGSEHRGHEGGGEGHREPHALGRFGGEGPHGRSGGMRPARSFGGRHGRR